MYTNPSTFTLTLCFSQTHSLMPLILAAKRLVRPSIPREYTTLSQLSQLSLPWSFTLIARFSVSSRFPSQMLLTFYKTRAHTHTSARLVSPTLPPSSLTYFFLAFFYSRFGQPHGQRILSSLFPPASRLHPDFH